MEAERGGWRAILRRKDLTKLAARCSQYRSVFSKEVEKQNKVDSFKLTRRPNTPFLLLHHNKSTLSFTT